MHLKTRNVNTAFRTLVEMFRNMEERSKSYRTGTWEWSELGFPEFRVTDSRNGPVMLIDEPLTVTYERPLERVLFNPVRDANPFFHLYESLWMLAGRDDVDGPAFYAKQIREYSDDGKRLNGAYGRRWRATQGVPQIRHNRPGYYRPGIDQLNILLAHLKEQPNSRRAVLRMWNVEEDLLKIGGRCICGADRSGPSAEAHEETCPAKYAPSKDVCCNLDVMFAIRETDGMEHLDFGDTHTLKSRYLDMTVVNRSNDLLWGMLGANYVHFTILQEYMAARLGVSVGRYHHITNNCHVYTTRKDWRPEDLLTCDGAGDGYSLHMKAPGCGPLSNHVPLVKDPVRFDTEVQVLVEAFSGPDSLAQHSGSLYDQLTEPFLRDVAYPMLVAHWWHKAIKGGRKDEGDRQYALSNVQDDAWRIAGQQWMQRRGMK